MTTAAAPPTVLWDIDGTLLGAAGTGVRTYTIALQRVTGLEFPSASIDMGGRTDPDIAALVLGAHGIDDDAILALMLAEVEAAYEEFEHEYRELTAVKPGIAAALRHLAEHDALQTIVTGNLESIARRKVAAAGLDPYVRFELGGYGSDHRMRAELVRMSMDRIAAAGHDVAAERTWIVGDTPRDLQCARDNGVRCVLVATGTYTIDQLAGLGADAVFDDLADTEAFTKLLS